MKDLKGDVLMKRMNENGYKYLIIIGLGILSYLSINSMSAAIQNLSLWTGFTLVSIFGFFLNKENNKTVLEELLYSLFGLKFLIVFILQGIFHGMYSNINSTFLANFIIDCRTHIITFLVITVSVLAVKYINKREYLAKEKEISRLRQLQEADTNIRFSEFKKEIKPPKYLIATTTSDRKFYPVRNSEYRICTTYQGSTKVIDFSNKHRVAREQEERLKEKLVSRRERELNS